MSGLWNNQDKKNSLYHYELLNSQLNEAVIFLMSGKVKPTIPTPSLTLLAWNGSIRKLVFVAGLCRGRLTSLQSHLQSELPWPRLILAGFKFPLPWKHPNRCFGLLHGWQNTWYGGFLIGQKVLCFVQMKGFQCKLFWLVWLPGFLKDKCVGNGVHRLSPCSNFFL